MAFVYMNVPPVFKTCMGEVDLDGNGRILSPRAVEGNLFVSVFI